MTQLSFFTDGDVATAAARMAAAGHGERGAVFTRREVVDFILDLVGYTADKPLCRFRLLEPSFGHGDFLVGVVGSSPLTRGATRRGTLPRR
ncbi:MAG TPA: hypothetical protein PLS67_10465 [Accumulibacter sp.]|jgi:hypothetical protein|nr:hypothetical protein [Accumulibacter sp.]HQC80922.1 hypothetical protein [Accumulibacter sp.]